MVQSESESEVLDRGPAHKARIPFPHLPAQAPGRKQATIVLVQSGPSIVEVMRGGDAAAERVPECIELNA